MPPFSILEQPTELMYYLCIDTLGCVGPVTFEWCLEFIELIQFLEHKGWIIPY